MAVKPFLSLLLAQVISCRPDLVGKFPGVQLCPGAFLQLRFGVVCLDKIPVVPGGLHAVQGAGVRGAKDAFALPMLRLQKQMIAAVGNVVRSNAQGG